MWIQPVILSGGSGTRLWPLSREKYPKQLLPLIGEDSLLQATVRRVEGIADLDLAPPMVVCGEEYLSSPNNCACLGKVARSFWSHWDEILHPP